MSKRWTLVTGANGFLGARLIRKLIERGEKVKAFVRPGADLSLLSDLPSEQLQLAVGDTRLQDRVYAALAGCSKMYHLAANVSFDERIKSDVIDSSVEGTRATLQAARRAGLEKIVVTSSVATLGATHEAILLDEHAEFTLENPNCYTIAKQGAEIVALNFAREGAPIVVVNPAMMIGPGDSKPTPLGQQIINYLELSPSFRAPTLPGGLCFADVDDVAMGHIAAMEKGRVAERYILGGENLTYHELILLMSDVTGLAEPGDELSRFKASLGVSMGELWATCTGNAPQISKKLFVDYFDAHLFVSSDKAKRELGYESRPLRESLTRSCRWFLDNDFVSFCAAKRARLELLPA